MAPTTTTDVKVKMYFAPTESIQAEMARISRLRREEPSLAKAIMDHGDHLLQLARKGNLRELIGSLESTPKEHLLQWFIIRMFRECCQANQVHVAKFMLERGLDPSSPPLLDTLHQVIHAAKYDDSTWVAMVKILTSSGFLPNYQKPPSYKTALHEASSRELVSLAETLIDAGADVNAVAAEDDMMPLNCADLAAAVTKKDGNMKMMTKMMDKLSTNTGVGERGEEVMMMKDLSPMQSLLISRGAKRTWRKPETAAEAQRGQRLQDFLDSVKEVGEGTRTFSTDC